MKSSTPFVLFLILCGSLCYENSVALGVAPRQAATASQGTLISDKELPPKTIVFVTDSISKSPKAMALFETLCGYMGESCKRGKRFSLPRSQFVSAHPEANLDTSLTRVKRPLPKARKIPHVSGKLDTTASENAVILDCKTGKNGLVSNCGVYLYRSSKQSVTSSSVRHFSTPIQDPSKWAEPLYVSFLEGISAAETLKEQEALQSFYANNNSEAESTSVMGLGLDASVFLPRGDAWSAIPKGTLQLSHIGEKGTGGVYFSYAKSHQRPFDKNLNIQSLGGGLQGSLRSHALQNLVWELSLQAGWERFQLEQGSKTQSDSLVLGTRPTLWFQMGTSTKLGLGVLWTHRTPLRSQFINGDNNISNFAAGPAWEPGMRFELTF